MIKNLTLLAILLFLTETAVAQSKLPVIKATKKSVAIRDGDVFTTNAWSLSPEAKPDVFTATRTQKTKKVTFYTDLDSITVKLKPNSKYDFIILLNDKDSCFTQIRSAFQETDSERKDRLKYPNKADTIPFRLTAYNNISIKAVINQVDTLNLMFHAAVDDVSITKETLTRTKSLKMDKKGEIRSWGGVSSTVSSEFNSVQIGNLKWDNLEITATTNVGQETDGKFGHNFFQNKILEINYDDSHLVVLNRLPKSLKGFSKLPIVFKGGSFFIEGLVKLGENTYKNQFMYHTGYAGNLILGTRFIEKNALHGKLDTLEQTSLKDSYGNVLKNIKTNIATLTLGNTNFTNISGSVMDAKAKMSDSIFGNDLLKRFNVFIDFQKDFIYLKPNKLLNSPHKKGV